MTIDNFCIYLQNRLIQTSYTGGQWYSDTSPFSIPCTNQSTILRKKNQKVILDSIQTTSFSLELDGPSKLVCYITIRLKGLQGTNSIAYGPILKLHRQLSIVNTTSDAIFTMLYFLHNL